MFEKTRAYKHTLKKNQLLNDLSKAKEDNNVWKINQLEGKIYCFNRKYYPNIFWDSSLKGTYRKSK